LSTAVVLEQQAVPVSEMSPAKLIGNPKLPVELSGQEVREALQKKQSARKNARSTS